MPEWVANSPNHLSYRGLFATIPRHEWEQELLPETGGILEQGPAQTSPRIFPKATVLHRFIAKSLDVLIVLGVGEFTPPYGFWVALWYVLVADGFSGRSIGKRLIGLQAWLPEEHAPAGFKDSIIRNVPLAVGYIAFQIPYVGWLGTLAVLGIESLLIIGNEHGLRIGDELAHTQVVDETIFDVESQS